GRRTAVIGTVAILTSPIFVFLARQAVPDPVFVGLLNGAMACLMIVLFEDEPREGWAAAFFCLVGFATLSKGLLGFALPGAVALLHCIVTGEWHRLRRLHLGMGALIVLGICAPWYGTLFAFDGRDDEGKTFFERFILHDHFKRLALGVHTTTPGGSFTYFIEQIGYDCFPWVFAFPGAATVLARMRLRPQTPRERALLFLLFWLLIGFAVFARMAQLWRWVRALPSRQRRAELRAAWRARMQGAPLATAEPAQDRNVAVWSLVLLAISFAIFCGWFHWRRLSPHWTQRDLFW